MVSEDAKLQEDLHESSNKIAKFFCSICGKKFTRKDYLARHSINHKNVKPFQCDQCQLSFSRSDLLSKHFKSKTHKRLQEEYSKQSVGKVPNKEVILVEQTTPPKKRKRIESVEIVIDINDNNDNNNYNDDNDKNSINSDNSIINNNTKRFKRLEIESFLNDDEKPPPQPDYVRPIIDNENSNVKKIERNGYFPEQDFQINPGNQDHFIDNLVWLFSDVSPSGDLNSYSYNQNNNNTDFNNNTNISSAPTTNSSITEAPNYFDINPVKNTTNNENVSHGERIDIDINNMNNNMKTISKKINQITFKKIKEFFPKVPELNDITLDRLNELLELYWFGFDETFPIIHKPTFNPNTSDVYLVISMFIIGLCYSFDKYEYKLSILLNKHFRRNIRDIVDLNYNLPLEVIQALILHNFSAKNFGDITLNKLSQIDHGANILYLRFSGLLDTLTEPIISKAKNCSSKELHGLWLRWVYYETCKRTVFFQFICDTQHVIFCRLQLLTVFDIKLELPCTDKVWLAKDPMEFFKEYYNQPRKLINKIKLNLPMNGNKNEIRNDSATPIIKDEQNVIQNNNNNNSVKIIGKWPNFLWTLKFLMLRYKDNNNDHQKEYSLSCYSLFTRYIILHGLMRICWDMRSQGLLDLGVMSNDKLDDFFQKLQGAFLSWKEYFDLHGKLFKKSEDEEILLNDYNHNNGYWANLSFYYTGLFTLYADTTTISKFAIEYQNPEINNLNNKKHNNKSLKEIEYDRTQKIIKNWAISNNGEKSIVEACKFLSLVFKYEETIETFSHIPGTVYLAAIMIWSFEIKLDEIDELLEIIRKMKKINDDFSYDEIDELLSNNNLDASKYFNYEGKIKKELAKKDAIDYFEIIINHKQELSLNEFMKTEKEFDKIIKFLKNYRDRQQKSVGVICYILSLLKSCKWQYSTDLVDKLNHVVESYEL